MLAPPSRAQAREHTWMHEPPRDAARRRIGSPSPAGERRRWHGGTQPPCSGCQCLAPRQKLLQMLLARKPHPFRPLGKGVDVLGVCTARQKGARAARCCPKSPRRCVPISCTTNARSPAPPEHRFLLLCRLRRSPGGCWCSGSFAVLIFRAPNSAELIQAVRGGEKARGDDNCGLGAPAFWIPAPCGGLNLRGFGTLLGKPGAPEGIQG